MDIAAALHKAGFTAVEKSQIRLPDGSFKAVGEYPVQVALHADVVSDITVVVKGEMV
jgi:large subunit ribosomal protein L9